VLCRREFAFDIRNVLFLMGLCGSTLYAATLVMRIQTYASRVVEMCSSFLNTIAFHILLYLWSVFVMQIRRNRSIYYLRAFILFSVLTMTFSTVLSAVMLNSVPTQLLAQMSLIVSYWVTVTQMILAIMFLVYAFNFRQRRKGMQISDTTNDALNRLQWLAGIAFFAYMALAFTNLAPINAMMITPQWLAAIILLRIVASSVRGIALSSVMGVRMPNRSASNAVMTYHGSTAIDSQASSGFGYPARKGSAWNGSEVGTTRTICYPATPVPAVDLEKTYPVPAYVGSGSWPMHRPLYDDADSASSVQVESVIDGDGGGGGGGGGGGLDEETLSETTQRDAYAYLRDDPYASWQPQQYEEAHSQMAYQEHDVNERV